MDADRIKELDYYLVILFDDGLLDVEANKSFVSVLKKMIKLNHIPSAGDTVHIPGWDGFLVKWIDYMYWTEKPVIQINTDFPNISNLKPHEGGYDTEDRDGEPGEFLIHKCGYTSKYDELLKKIFKEPDLPSITEFLNSCNLRAMPSNVIKFYYVDQKGINDLSVLIDDVKTEKIKRLRQFGNQSLNALKEELRRNIGVDL